VDDFRIRRAALTEPDDAEHVWWDVIAPAFDELKTPYEHDPRLRSLSPGQRALYALHWTTSEVANGGFHQYLRNPTGMLAEEALGGAELIGSTDVAGVLRALLALFPDGLLMDQQDRSDFVGRFDQSELDELRQLDERFFALLEGEPSPLAVCCAAYVAAHPEEFFVPQPQLRP
jgi:hypothetical protein